MQTFGTELDGLGYNFYSGVPCSFLKSMINYAINKDEFVMSVNEGDAVAICAGAYLGGKKPIFLCQNSGLTNALSPLTSLNHTFQIPVLGFVSLRGEPGIADEPQHELMGTITEKLLLTSDIPCEVLSENPEEAKEQLIKADAVIEKGQSFFFIVKKNTFNSTPLLPRENTQTSKFEVQTSESEKQSVKRLEVLELLQKFEKQEVFLLATTGVTGRELYELADRPNQLYMVGSMGCISSLGLGLALARPDKKIIVIDGDGSLLMRMGSLATNAFYSPGNLYHLLLDNNKHESTGGQQTVSHNMDFLKIAEGSGYQAVEQLHSLDDIEKSIEGWIERPVLTFGYFQISAGIKENLSRPKVKPHEVKERFMSCLNGELHD